MVELSNPEAECTLLGTILRHDAVFYEIHNDIAAEDFSDPRNQAIYRVVTKIAASARGRFSAATVRDFLASERLSPPIDDSYIDVLLASDFDQSEAPAFAKAISDLSRRRRAITAMRGGIDRLERLGPEIDLGVAIDEINGDILDAAQADTSSCKTLGEWAEESFRMQDDVFSGRRVSENLRWGLTAIDDTCGPMSPGDMAVMGGRPGAGKSALAGQVAECWGTQAPGVVFSLEMRGRGWANRSIAQEARIAGWRITRNLVNQIDQLEAMAVATEKLKALPVWIDDRSRLTIEQIRAKAIGLKRRHGIRWGILDYVQIVKASSRHQPKVDVIDHACEEIASLGKELDMVWLVLSQLNLRNRIDKYQRPVASDLMFFSSIEPHADVILFPFRPEVALAERQPSDRDKDYESWQQELMEARGKAEIINAKSRHGRGYQSQACRFNGDLMRFEDAAERSKPLHGEDDLASF